MHRQGLSKSQTLPFSKVRTVPNLKKVARQMAIIKKAGEGLNEAQHNLGVEGGDVIDAADAANFFADAAFQASLQAISVLEDVVADIISWEKKKVRE